MRLKLIPGAKGVIYKTISALGSIKPYAVVTMPSIKKIRDPHIVKKGGATRIVVQKGETRMLTALYT